MVNWLGWSASGLSAVSLEFPSESVGQVVVPKFSEGGLPIHIGIRAPPEDVVQEFHFSEKISFKE